MSNFDFKKEYKDLYMPNRLPHLIQVPAMKFIAIQGTGNPNQEGGEYQQTLQYLYALSFTIKMSERAGTKIPGYFPYVVPPLEGYWWSADRDLNVMDGQLKKENLSFFSMIRQPDFVNAEIFAWACEEVQRKKQLQCDQVQFLTIEEGLCVQMMHLGPYDDEPASFAQMDAFIQEQGYQYDLRDLPGAIKAGAHHEIYLGDPRKCKPERLRTVLRKQVKRG